MVCHCGVCARRLSDATENYGPFETNKSFVGWDVPEGHRAVIRDTCESCAEILRDAVTTVANEIVAKNRKRVSDLSRLVDEQRERDKAIDREKAEFEKAWREHREKTR